MNESDHKNSQQNESQDRHCVELISGKELFTFNFQYKQSGKNFLI